MRFRQNVGGSDVEQKAGKKSEIEREHMTGNTEKQSGGSAQDRRDCV